jgi:ornithine--oxo-acid transaminase
LSFLRPELVLTHFPLCSYSTAARAAQVPSILSTTVRAASQAVRAAPVQKKLTSQEHIALERQYSAHNCDTLPVVLSRGKGVHVWDVEGKRYLDCLASYACVNQGHSHPVLIDALLKQAEQIALTSRAFHNDALGEYAKFMTEYFGYERMLPMNTGVEAWETACKLARRWGYDVKGIPANQARLVFANGCFHGRSIAACSASSDPNSYVSALN